MSYGTSSYGSSAIAGASASEWFIFFPHLPYDPDVLFEAELEFNGPSGFFSLFSNQNTESGEGILYQAFTANDSNETPQLQTTFAGIGQAVIGSARFITVTAEIDSAVWAGGIQFSIRGRVGD